MRTCTDNYFKNRSRPCMLYQIKRCSAPCVNLVSNIEYEKLTKDTISFLEGNDSNVKDKLISNTENAVNKGAFGAPTMFVGDQMFFGQDRVEFVEEYLNN